MSVQITVRLPGELVSFLDDSVAEGRAQSRAALVASALEREMRRQAAITDARILAEQGPGDDLDALVSWSVSNAALED
ncbi:ribbon-helix-helix domain-containing protein [Propionibacterium australiense]|uniref:Arc-type ribbon-helix-helix n=1 Tax=Propionibacterium australiense TaxID=119981 RepID=A0A383S5J5_9ACTN|nr:ribbon-helix-helix domain-containing protein [Propionibacterium australiense]RLP11149.1 hypothetical protein D7U36_05085 [Propionibacterium australiense]RLP12478.1 hypothetical protein D9T14_01120 [Propionibacterium australiense]SYZ32704.1 Arc-type ribbon-helix-helix [Propionibacterium australiense]VEH91518.1 Antitoxin MazE3 [Propionibacterium australiense]